ncbi:UDP-glucose 4-epimerase GalE [Cellulomonas sp. NPDC058312]|uniref:UDP-glucose 4-epimerase GalE n=1 Tax=Cellulomonas sp. NPDC058312 TaxID=3346441 RepID=UPI0036E192B4
MTVLVTGGAGYIGTHVVRLLRAAGRDVVVVDDLSSGRAERVAGTELVRLDVAGPGAVRALGDVVRRRGVSAVVHLAARKRVDESVAQPLRYYRENIEGFAAVLAACTEHGVRSVVFSSSAAVYGDVAGGLVGEDAPTRPVNPYGRSKLVGEWLLRDVAATGSLRGTALRYFNVAGAGWPDLGDPAVTNLVTLVLDAVRHGRAPRVLGTDFPTPDGSGVRDYVHVLDLARAHVAALDGLAGAGTDAGAALVPPFRALNVGTGVGTSVLAVIRGLSAAMGVPVVPELVDRRPGDPAEVVADPRAIEAALGWRAVEPLDATLASAWAAWQHAHGGEGTGA